MNETIRTGGCRCGRVTFHARGEPLRVGVCHCESCRRATGSAFAVFVDYPDGAATISGDVAVWSGTPGAHRLFCPRCGSPIAYRGDPWPGETSLHLGAFADPAAFPPPHHVTFESEALSWAHRALAPVLAGSGA